MKLWNTWCKVVDDRPVELLIALFLPILIWEGVSKNAWIPTLVIFIISFVCSYALSISLKVLFKDSRGKKIKTVMDYRRPSAHTLISVTLSVVASLMDKILFVPLLIFTVLAAYSRIWVGAHNSRDVAEGAVAGFLLGILLFEIFSFTLL